MKAKEAFKAFGGKAKADRMADNLSAKYGILVEIAPHVNEEKPTDNWMNVMFTYRTENEANFIKAFDELQEEFFKCDLEMEYECNGDGDGIRMSYRVR